MRSSQPTSTHPRFTRSPKQKFGRFAILPLVYLFFAPAMKVVDWLGLSSIVLGWAGRKIQRIAVWPKRYADYRPSEHDVFVCTYFKSGTNWMMQMTHQIAHRGHAEFVHIHDFVPWPEIQQSDFAVDLCDEMPRRTSPTGLRIIKTHLQWKEIPYTREARYIMIVRDPKDVLVSSYPFIRGVALGPMMPSLSNWLDLFLTHSFFECYWPDHVHGYWSERHRENVLFLNFKEIKQDLPGTVRRVSEFMGIELTAEEFGRVCDKSEFSYMKRIGDRFAPGVMTPLGDPETPMVRSGKQGGAAELLSVADQERIDASFKRALADLGSDFDYDAISTPASAGSYPHPPPRKSDHTT